MATSFELVRGFVRALLGDVDPSAYQYSDSALNQHIRLLILTLDNPEVQEAGETESFTTDLSPRDKCLVVYRTVESVITVQSDHFSYRTPVLSVVRKGGVSQLLSFLQKKLAEIEGGGFLAISSEMFVETILREPERFWNEYRESI